MDVGNGSPVTREDLKEVATKHQFGRALRSAREYAGLSIRGLESASKFQLKKNMIDDMEKGNRIDSEPPGDGRLEVYLALCRVLQADVPAWQETWQRVCDRPADPVLPGAAVEAPSRPGITVRPRTVVIAAAIIAALAATATIIVQTAQPEDSSATSGVTGSPDPRAEPADPASPPLLVVDVTRMGRATAIDDFVLPGKLDMDAAALDALNNDIAPNSEKFAQWSSDHDVVPLERGLATLTVRANDQEPVRIVRMSAQKECGAPFDGTFFRFPKQGGGEPTVKLGINLDAPDTFVQEMYNTVDGLYPAGPDYFQLNTITLKPGETQTFAVGGFTKRYGCAFMLRVFVVTANRILFQDIGVGGKSFKVTAMAIPKAGTLPYSGYGAAYLPLSYPSKSWTKVDPQTHATN